MAITRSEEIKSIIESSFSNDRAFSFYLNEQIVESLRSDDELTSSHDSLLAIRDASIDSVTEDKTARERLRIDARLTHALLVAITTVHKVAASQTRLAFSGRRFVIVAPNRSDSGGGQREPIVVHSGLGPVWREIPSLYLDLRIFTRIEMDEDAETVLARVLAIEERSVETGFDYIASDLEQKKRLISELYARIEPGVFTFPVVAAAGRGVTTVQRLPKAELFEMLDRRDPDSNLDFHHSAVLEAVRRLEEAASLADANDDLAALEDVVELLVTASGHDVHDARSRANIALERIFAPKEYDAPPATEFRTMTTGSTETILFHLPEGEKYVARIYSPEPSAYITTNEKLRIDESPLTRTDDGWELAITPTKIGFLDYVIVRPGESISRSTLPSGRINILPPVSGEIVLQIFPDIHGHTRVYWKRGDGHPGLVYNESGEVIRLGNFGDISEHLEDLKSRYQITGVYILGAQSRGKNTEDWAEGATSPSPFSPMSLTTMETGLGGDQAFRRLVDRAHELDIKVIVDILPHVNRASNALPEDLSVRCYDPSGSLVVRGSTDGRFGSWNDGKLLNYRRFEVWRWISESIRELVEQFDIDGIRIDSAHAVPIMMKKTNFPYEYNRPRTHEEMVRGAIIVNDREDDHYITTGYYDSECRDRIACPFYTFLARSIVEIISAKSDDYFVTYAECYWGRERYLARSGVIPYNSALFKICENITHGRSDIGEIYHLYDHYYRETLPPGTAMVGILGNHDERRALNTFGQRGVRAAIALTTFMSCIVLDYEGSAEGESWKVYMDNIFVNWNQFEFAAHRSLQGFYEEIYHFHRGSNEAGHLIRTNSGVVAAAIKRKGSELWIGAFSFSADNEGVGLEFDSDRLPIDDDRLYRLIDPVYSAVTGIHGYYAGYELKISSIRTMVAYTDRVKYLVLEERPESEFALSDVFRDSFVRLSYLSTHHAFTHSLAFRQFIEHLPDTQDLISATKSLAIRATVGKVDEAAFVLKRLLFHAARESYFDLARMDEFVAGLDASEDDELVEIGSILAAQQAGGDLIFITAEADPFSKSGGLANVLYELPRELARRGESVYVITPMYRNGTDQAVEKMQSARNRHRVRYTNLTVRFYIEHVEYEAGVHRCEIEGVTYLLFDHHEFFDGLYWGHTAEEKLRRRIALARCSAEIIRLIPLEPLFVFTNDAFAGPFNGIICGDQYYANHPVFKGTSFFHIIHNGGWQYFDSYDRYQNGKDLFSLFNLDPSLAGEFSDPVHQERLNCMAVGIRFADRSITVSPSYALQLREAGDGLERIVGDIVGINNAIAMDYSRRAIRNQKTSLLAENNRDRLLDALTADQALNRRIEQSFPEIFESIDAPDRISQRRRREIVVRMRNKLFMQLEFGLRIDPDAIVAVMLHRVTDQKGYQLLLEASGRIVTELGMQLIVGGPVIWDDEEAATLARGLQNLPGWYPGSVATRVGFQDVRVPLLGSELFLMPSRHEPGGISQLEALACGCLVVARATGGLRDTITPLVRKNGKITGNGTLFTDYNSEAFFDGICRFKATWDEFDDDERYSARISARKSVYYWGKPADRYIAETYGYKEIIHA